MKSILPPTLCAALVFGASTLCSFAQSPSPNPTGTPDGPPPPHHRPPPSPLFEALDANHDGVLSSDEIANAPAALAKLAGPSGQITRDSLRPPPPDGADRPKDGPDDPGARPGSPDADRHHGPPRPDGERRPDRHPPAANGPAASPSASPGGDPGEQGPPPRHGPPHGGPLFDALDTNHDGTISAAEIANAAASLKTLDKNGDGQLTHDELRPPPPPRGPGN